LPKHVVVPLIIASALFIQQLDATALATSLPAIADALNESPLRLHLAITSYMLSLAAFLPVSGWAADRFGARLVFRVAIAVFTLSSALCGLATSFEGLIIPRILQGMGGAMMVPVGRLILVRTVSKAELVKALAVMSMPALVAPILGPLVGGFITTYFSWRWIFWINLPIGVLGILLITRFIDDVREPGRRRFDMPGFVLSGFGLSGLLFGIDAAASESIAEPLAFACIAVGAISLALYVFHARRTADPILDLSLLRAPTFRASVTGGSFFRIGAGAMPFLLPLLFQEGFGYTPFESGMITFVSAVGSLGMRSISSRVLRRFGFRRVLRTDAVIASAFIAACALISPAMPYALIIGILFFGGVFRSLEMMSINALAFADLDHRQMSHATSFSTMAQRLSQSTGVALAAFVLHVSGGRSGTINFDAFATAFATVAIVSCCAALVFARLEPEAGAELAGRATSRPEPARSSETA
jgi:EmrB/QacA subfamily drug resistance transporter